MTIVMAVIVFVVFAGLVGGVCVLDYLILSEIVSEWREAFWRRRLLKRVDDEMAGRR